MAQIDITQAFASPTVLYQGGDHAVYWLGINEPAD